VNPTIRAERQQQEEVIVAAQKALAEAGVSAGADGAIAPGVVRLMEERDALRADLARVSEEMGLPQMVGPAPGELRRSLRLGKDALARLAELEARALEAPEPATKEALGEAIEAAREEEREALRALVSRCGEWAHNSTMSPQQTSGARHFEEYLLERLREREVSHD